jgi:hypothetical protein
VGVLGAKQLHIVYMAMLLGRCWPSKFFQRHGLQNHSPCALCSQDVEHRDHLLLSCVYSHEVWLKVLRRCGLATVIASSNRHLHGLVAPFTHPGDLACRKQFDTLLIVVVWNLWLQRNSRVFRGESLGATCLIPSI